MDLTDKQLEEILRRTEAPIGDDGFTGDVLDSLPKRKFEIEKSRRWTLAGASAAGSFLTLLLAPPVEIVLRFFDFPDNLKTMFFAVLLSLIFLFVPVAWFLYSQLEKRFKLPAMPNAPLRSRMLRF
jgi:hypothetical protein